MKYGRRPPKNAPALMLAPLLTGAMPAHPSSEDYLSRLSNWQMLGNDAYGDCVAPETRVLTADLQWIPAGDLTIGTRLLAFDEESRPDVSGGRGKGRYYRSSVVECVDRVVRPMYELEFDDGTIVRCSAGHRWLIGSLANGARWAKTENLKAGGHNASSVGKPLDVWEMANTRAGGYLAGAFDGEGNLDQSVQREMVGANRVAFSQVGNSMLNEVEEYLRELNVPYRHQVQPRGGNSGQDGATRQDIHRLSVGRRSDFLRFLGTVRPERLIAKLDPDKLGRLDRTHVARLIRKTNIGLGEVVKLDTSSRTYFAEGLTSHNCVAVTWANARRLVTATLAGRETYPNLAAVEMLYKTQNPGFPAEDNGMDIQTCLEYLTKTGGPDGVKAIAFAKVDPTNLEEVKAALAIFGFVWTGLYVLAANEQQFSRGQAWDYVARSPVVGGHSVLSGGYLGQSMNDVRFITWAKETGFTDSFWSHEVEEAWVVIWPEHLGTAAFQAGVDLNALATAYQALTGRTLPIPPPPPPPTPYVVLPGILRAMDGEGDTPATNESPTADGAIARGTKGLVYVYWRGVDRTVVSNGKVYA